MSLKITQHMTRKLLNLSKIALLVFSISFLFGSCTKETFIENPIHQTEWYVNEFNIRSADWKWDDNLKLYYADGTLPDLDSDIYDKGAVIGYVYLGTQGQDEVMSVLPYLGPDDNYERIWFDVSYDLGRTVRFYYQWNNLANIRPANYNFKITLIY